MRRLLLVPLVLAVGASAFFALAARSASRAVDCVLVPEAERALDLQNSVDRDHLGFDARRIERAAEQYRDYVRTIPAKSQSLDAQRTLASRPDRAYRYCVAILDEQVAATHHVASRAVSELGR